MDDFISQGNDNKFVDICNKLLDIISDRGGQHMYVLCPPAQLGVGS